MIRTLLTAMGAFALSAVVITQGTTATDVMKAARQALGGEARMAAVKTLQANGRTRALAPNGQVEETEFAMSLELPDRFMRREVLMAMGPTSVYRHTGFNGDALIDEVDAPPALASGGGGGLIIRRIDADGPGPGRGPATPDETAARERRLLSEARHSFARLTLGMFATSFTAFPLTFTYSGQAAGPDGRADVIDVTDGDEFQPRLFVDAATHMPLMLTWMDKEPIQIRVEDSGGGENVTIVTRGGGPGPAGGNGAGANDGPGDLETRLREAEASQRTVEFRMFYEDYREVDGVKIPMRITRTIDGKPSTEIVFDRVRLNGRIDPKTFTPSK